MQLRALLLACGMMLLTACSQPADDTIRFGLASAPANLDPRYATDATSARINRLLYRRLVDFDENTRPRAALANWDLLAPTHYRFHLDPQRAHFHDGRALTAADVAATYQSILDPDRPSAHAGALQLIERIEVLDDDTLDFRLKRPDPLFPGYLVIGLLPADAIASNHPFHESPLGSGPFELRDWPEPGRLSLTRREDGQVIEFQGIGDPTVRVLKLLRGEVDIVQNDLPAELLGYLDDKAAVQVTFAEGSNFAYIGFNLENPQTSILRVRQAVAHAINRDAIIEYVLGGAARPAAALLPPDHWAGNPALPDYPYDPERARGLLAEAGFSAAHPLQLTYKTSTDAVRVRIATIIQQQLREVGIETSLQSYDWGTFYGDIKSGHFQMYSLAWVGIKTPDIFRYAFHSSSLPPEGANRGRLVSPRVDALIEAAEQGDSLPAQAAAYREVQQELLQQLPYIPLWYEDHVFAARSDIAGYRLAQDGNFDGLQQVHRRAP